MSEESLFSLVTTTCGSEESARHLAAALVGERLAACVQIMPIESFYRWQGAVQNEREFLLLCKIKRADYPALEAAILRMHDYDTPEIIELDISRGAPAYLAWIRDVTV
ncbi:divalent-cation tolerance protein CutA [Beijerinckia mobilis]|uniref:divalent-cation tolerance protein CutA n=1 Tax=Beijerinckia mobilis TaxID=231434 RepID=UPI0005577D30|nr:divalent-cation tolerance protein CutA [Beijerinckia mobilis]